jgi:hypothetical protein
VVDTILLLPVFRPAGRKTGNKERESTLLPQAKSCVLRPPRKSCYLVLLFAREAGKKQQERGFSWRMKSSKSLRWQFASRMF